MKKTILFILVTLTAILLIVSCDLIAKKKIIDNNNDTPIIPTGTTIAWGLDNSADMVQFYTNDTRLITSNGSTFWQPKSYKDAGLAVDIIDVTVDKVSGLSDYGYGIIFCIQDDLSNDIFIARNFYSLLIRTTGEYQIIKVVENTNDINKSPIQHRLNDWQTAIDASGDNIINTGKNINNRIKVVIDDPDSNNKPNFHIYINDCTLDNFEDNFLDDNGTPLPQFYKSNGAYKYGFIVTLGPNEDFPNTPVDVRFTQAIPDYSKGLPVTNKSYGKGSIDDNNLNKIFLMNSSVRSK